MLVRHLRGISGSVSINSLAHSTVRYTMRRLPLVQLIFGAAIAASAFGQPVQRSCEDLAKTAVANTHIVAAKSNTAAKGQPAHCEVEGKVNERKGIDGKPYAIGFHLRMPADWNGNLYFQG